MAGRLLSLGALVLLSAGCGSEVVTSGDTRSDGSYRIETRTEIRSADGSTHTLRWTSTGGGDASSSLDETTGCRSVLIGNVSYNELPPGSGLPAGKRWVRYVQEEWDDEAAFEDTLEQRTTEVTSGDGTSTTLTEASMVMIAVEQPGPSDYLAEIRKDAEPELVGQETIDGVPTTHYRATVDQRRPMRRQLEADGWKPANVDLYLAQMGAPEQRLDLWVDSDGIARRIVTTQDDTSFHSVTTTDYFMGAGEPVEAPPAAEVVESGEWQRFNEDAQAARVGAATDDGLSLPGAFQPAVQPSCR